MSGEERATASEHEHVFRRASLTYADGTPLDGGRRCECGVEVVGDGPFALNAGLVRAGREFNQAVMRGMVDLANQLEVARRRRYP